MTSRPPLSGYLSSWDTSSKRTLREPQQISSFFLLLVACAVILGAVKLGVGTLGSPGPGFLPFLAALVLAISSGIYFLSVIFSKLKNKNRPAARLWAGTKWTKVLYLTIALSVYSACFEYLGFIICTFLLMTLMLIVMEVKHWYTVLASATLISVMSYLVFEKLLTIGFPAGLFGF